jgi:hypothetical protein
VNKVEEEREDRVKAALAAILEAFALMSGARRSKCHASDSDVEVALQAEKLKILKNEGNSDSMPSSVYFDTASIIPNLDSIGISFRVHEGSTSKGLMELSRAVHGSSGVANSVDKKIEVIELEEKELEDEEEVDRVLLQNICGEIMEEVMDVGGDDFIIPPSHVAKNRARKKGGEDCC